MPTDGNARSGKACYHAYLESPEWRQKRDLVLTRSNGLCEVCGGLAVLAHHLTYAHAGNEFLFELVALCKRCHDRIHDPNPEIEGLKSVEEYALSHW